MFQTLLRHGRALAGFVAFGTAALFIATGCSDDCSKTLTCVSVETHSTGGSGGTGGTPATGGGGSGGGGPALKTQVSAGHDFTCASDVEGRLSCWGTNDYGQLGNGTIDPSSVPIKLPSSATRLPRELGFGHSCAWLTNDSLACWGWNQDGQLGDGTFSTRLEPTALRLPIGLIDVSLGYYHTCGIWTNGEVDCWGYNASGQLGSAAPQSSPEPVVAISTNAVEISCGGLFSCARMNSGEVRCWGDNSLGQLGNGSLNNTSSTPTQVLEINDASAVTAGNQHTCAIVSDGAIKCWGTNSNGQLGNSQTSGNSPIPIDVVSLTQAIEVAAGSNHTCAIISGGSVWCWGDNDEGQLGDGTFTDSDTPVEVANIENIVSLSTSNSHTCATSADDIVYCWGAGTQGQLGTGADLNAGTPVPVFVARTP